MDDWSKYIFQLEDIFSSDTFPERVKLNSIIEITDVKKFIHSHLEMVKHHNGNKFFIPYIERLYQLKRILYGKDKKTKTD